MVVELRSLRVVSDFSAERYVAGMNEKIAADRAGVASSKAAGAAVDEQKIKISSAVPLIEKLSRTYVDGYGTASKFNTEMLKLARSQDTQASSATHLELVYTGLQKKFGLIADATELQRRGYNQLATAIENVNARLNQTGGAEKVSAQAARMDQLRQTLDPTYVSAQRLSAELADLAEAERLGVQITGGYERALDAIIMKHDATAAAARRQREEYARLAQEGREAAAADRAQASFNQQLGMFGGTGLRASDSASIFAEQLSRQEELARLRVQQQADQFAADLRRRQSYEGNPSSARDSASVFSAEFARQDELDRLRRQQQGEGFAADLNQRLGVNGSGTSARASAQAFEEAARAAEDLDRQTTLLRAQIDPLGAAQARLNKELADYEGLADRAKITTVELAQAQALARQRYDATAKEIDRQGKKGVSGLPSYQATNLLYQGTDVIQSLALGMPIMQVFLQQGPQIAQIFYQAEGSMQAVLGLINPITLGLSAIAAAAVVGGVAWNGYLQSIKEVETASAGLGRATSGTAADMEEAARAGAAAADISIKSARTMEAQFLRTGRIGSEHFGELIGLSKDFAATIGVDAASAGKTLADMFANPAQAAQTLYQQYGLISGATARQVTNLAAQNRESEAQSVLLNALPDQLARAAEATTALGRAWDWTGRMASDAMDAIGGAIDKAVSGPSLEERLKEAQAAQNSYRENPLNLLGLLSPTNAAKVNDVSNIDDLQEQIRRRNAAEFERQRRAAEIRRGQRIDQVANSSGANSDRFRIEALQNDIATLNGARTLGGRDEAQQARDNAALEAKTRVLDALINRQQRLAELDRLDIQIAQERNPVIRADLEARRTRLQMTDQEVDSSRIAEETARARTRVIEETIAAGRGQARDLQQELEIRTRLDNLVENGSMTRTDANRVLQEELTLRPLVAAAASAEGEERKRLMEVVDSLRVAYAGMAEEQKRAAAIDYLTSLNERTEQLRLEASLLGENEAVRGRATAALEAEQRIRRMGLEPGSALADRIREETDALAKQTREVERQAEAWKKVQSATESALDGAVDKLADGDWKGALKGAADDLKKMILELGVKNPLKNDLLGTDNPTLSDVGGIGGIISRLFGGSKADPGALAKSALSNTVGAMSVTAGTVVVNGGTGGGLPGVSRLQSPANSNDPFAAVMRGAGGGDISEYARAIKSIESSGNYGALGPITRNGDRAYGAYQVMGNNIGPWSEAALGRRLTADEFLSDNSAQDAIFKHRFGGYVEKYGASGAAQAWFGGPGSVGRGGAGADVLGTTGTAYVEKFQNALGDATSATKVASQGLGQLGGGLGQFGDALSKFPSAPQGGGGGGIGGWLSSLFRPSVNFSGSAQAMAALNGPIMGLYANGGISDRPAIFGEGPLPEAAVPLPDGRRIPVQLNLRGAMGQSRSVTRQTNFYNAPAGYDVTVEDEDDGYGNEKTNVVFSKMAANEARRSGSPLNKTLRAMGAREARVRR